jgi:HK97 family phage major capsid protein
MSNNGTVESVYKAEPLFTKEQVAGMVMPEIMANIKDQYDRSDEIERKYDGIISDPEDEHQVKRHLLTVDLLLDQQTKLQEALERKTRIRGGIEQYGQSMNGHRPVFGDVSDGQQLSPGDQFVRSNEYKRMKGGGLFNSALNRNEFSVQMSQGTSLIGWSRMLQKTLLSVGSGQNIFSGSPFVPNDIQPGVLSILQREINVLDLVPRLTTESDVIEWVQETTFTNNAGMVAEATATTGTTGTKPESALQYSAQTTPVRTLAHWIPVTNKMLGDAPQIRGIINSRLLLGLQLALETQIVSGDGTGENFLGILNNNINVQALGTDNVLDAIFKGRTLVRVTGKARPSAVVMHPNNWQTARLARENSATGTLGGYLMGPPSMVGANTLWGLPVVESEAMPAGTALVGDFSMGCTLFDREQAVVRIGFVNDQFIRNIQTLLAELRAAFIVWRPTAFSKVTGVP